MQSSERVTSQRDLCLFPRIPTYNLSMTWLNAALAFALSMIAFLAIVSRVRGLSAIFRVRFRDGMRCRIHRDGLRYRSWAGARGAPGVNVNTVTVNELTRLPSIDANIAAEIVPALGKIGDLARVGVSTAALNNMRSLIEFSG